MLNEGTVSLSTGGDLEFRLSPEKCCSNSSSESGVACAE